MKITPYSLIALKRSHESRRAFTSKLELLHKPPFNIAVEARKLECGPRTMYASIPSSQGFAVGGQSYCNFLASFETGLY